jgi:hypothetical protein
MGKTCIFPILIAAIMLAGCCSGKAAPPTPTVFRHWTALEAYEHIKPAMAEWHEDAFVFAISATRDPQQGAYLNDGTSPHWGFSVFSPANQKATVVALQGEEIVVGIDGKAGYEIPMSSANGLPLEEMIDSDEAVGIALENGVDTTAVVEKIRTNTYDGAVGRAIPLSWEFAYSPVSGLRRYRTT